MNILFTSSGRRGYLVDYFREAMQGNGEIHVGNSEVSSAMKGITNRVITPMISDPVYQFRREDTLFKFRRSWETAMK